MNTQTRLNAYIESKGLSVREFERICGLSNGSASKIADSSRKSTFDRISTSCPDLNIDWLLTGKGDMLKYDETMNIPAIPEYAYDTEGTIRYWEDVAATGGSLEFLENPDEHPIKAITVPRFADCTDAVNIYGDSMYPAYKSGEIILFRPWKESYIEYGQCYIIVTKGGHRMVKYLQKAGNDSKVLCVSENKRFEPFEIDRADIIRLFLVRGSIKADTI